MAQLILLGKSQLNRFSKKTLASRMINLKLGNPPSLESLHVSSLTNGNVSKKRSVTKGINVKRRRGDTRKKDIGRNKKSMLESRNVRIGGVHSSDTVGTKV